MSYQFHLGKLVNLGHVVNCNGTAYKGKINRMSPIYKQLSLITTIWARSYIIAIFTLFCTLVLVTSLLAEELDKRTTDTAFSKKKNGLTLALDNWLNKFHQLYLLVERINECFSPILAITVFYYFVFFPYKVFGFMHDVIVIDSETNLSRLWSRIPYNISYSFLMLFVRLVTIVNVCDQLQGKVII